MVEIEKGPRGLDPHPRFLILGKNEGVTEGRTASRTSKTNPLPTPLAQGLDMPLVTLWDDYTLHSFDTCS